MSSETDELDYDLSAWDAPAPSTDFADAVIARIGTTEDVAEPPAALPVEPRAPKARGLVLAGTAAACLVAGVGLYALIRSSRPAGPPNGEIVTDRARTLALDGVGADLDPGANVRWRRAGLTLHVEQRAGAAAWRVGGDEKLVIDAGATVASVEATGASLRVEVKMNSMDARVIGASALTAAAVSLVTVTVYSGHVRVTDATHHSVVVQPGATHSVAPLHGLDVEAPVVGASTPQLPDQSDVQIVAGTSLDRVAISSTMTAAKGLLAACRERTSDDVDGKQDAVKIAIHVKVQPNGLVDVVRPVLGDAAPLADCVVGVVAGLKFPATDQGGAFTYPVVFAARQATHTISGPACDPEPFKEKGMESINQGQHGVALAFFERALGCSADPYIVQLAFMSSCMSKNAVKAKVYFAKLTPNQQSRFAQICIRNKIDPQGGTSGPTCDAAALKDKGFDDINRGKHADAVASFTASYHCTPDATLPQIIVAQACAAKDAATARIYFSRLSPSQQKTVRTICDGEGITLPAAATMPTVAPGDAGFLVVSSKPSAKILIDGVDTGLTTPIGGKALPLTPGRHKVTFVIGEDRFTYPVIVTAGKTVSMSKDLQ